MPGTFENAYFKNLVHFWSMDSFFSAMRYIKYEISKTSLGFVEEELIIPEWFFKTTNAIDSERIEFKNDKKI